VEEFTRQLVDEIETRSQSKAIVVLLLAYGAFAAGRTRSVGGADVEVSTEMGSRLVSIYHRLERPAAHFIPEI
jgi:hypothetical protein